MAHANIEQRQKHVLRLLKKDPKIGPKARKSLAIKYACSSGAIVQDIVKLTRPKTEETFYSSKKIRAFIHNRDGTTCQYCGVPDKDIRIIEHVIPARHGGIAKSQNLVVACIECNLQKRSNTWIPKNLDEITKDHPEWKAKILSLAVK